MGPRVLNRNFDTRGPRVYASRRADHANNVILPTLPKSSVEHRTRNIEFHRPAGLRIELLRTVILIVVVVPLVAMTLSIATHCYPVSVFFVLTYRDVFTPLAAFFALSPSSSSCPSATTRMSHPVRNRQRRHSKHVSSSSKNSIPHTLTNELRFSP